jgi:hypothetical protein
LKKDRGIAEVKLFIRCKLVFIMSLIRTEA